jgi:hypothetical protein
VSARATDALLARLDGERQAIESLERQLTAARRRRRLLMVKATRAGLSTRQIGAHAGMSSPGVSQSVRSWQPDGA